MGKRNQKHERSPRDLYRTIDPNAINPLMHYLPPSVRFAEPCAADGILAHQLEKFGHRCTFLSDIEPLNSPFGYDIKKADALSLSHEFDDCDYIITNPPWSRDLLHPMIMNFIKFKPTWLLFDSDWRHTSQADAYLPFCHAEVSVGRLRWIEGSKSVGMDNSSWFLFKKEITLFTKCYPKQQTLFLNTLGE